MKLRVRLILSYMILALTGSLLLGLVYNHYAMEQHRNEIYTDFQFWGNQMLNQFEDSQKKMEQVTYFILSDQDFLYAVRSLSQSMRKEGANLGTMNSNRTIVRRNLNTAYILDNFYRVIVFNQYGVIASSDNQGDKMVDLKKDISTIPWIEKVADTKGNFVLIESHKDDWGLKENPEEVYSVVKKIQGENLGYIEIQKTYNDLKQILAIPDKEKKIILMKNDGTILYFSKGLDTEKYLGQLKREDGVYKVEVHGGKELISLQSLKDSQVRLMLVENWDDAMDSLPNTFGMTLVITSAFLLFSVCFIIITADRLTRPLRKLRGKMEETELSNIGRKIVIESSDADVQALAASYQRLLERLESSIIQEKKHALLQMQAQFDTLQAQVNPHFIYNVLNVISGRGIQNDDEVICDICGNLAAMLRYSTNVKERYATILQETDYLKNYVFILKARFENRLYVEIQIDEKIEKELVPKIMIHQLVENSIKHGYGSHTKNMEIRVKGYTTKKGWRLEVADNGDGISEAVLSKLEKSMKKVRSLIEEKKEMVELEIGGMGLANAYARMYLLYQERVIFDITNRSDRNGAIITIGVEGE